jgi:hypothetical protein
MAPSAHAAAYPGRQIVRRFYECTLGNELRAVVQTTGFAGPPQESKS